MILNADFNDSLRMAGAVRTLLSCPCLSIFVFGLLSMSLLIVCAVFSSLHVVWIFLMGGGFYCRRFVGGLLCSLHFK